MPTIEVLILTVLSIGPHHGDQLSLELKETRVGRLISSGGTQSHPPTEEPNVLKAEPKTEPKTETFDHPARRASFLRTLPALGLSAFLLVALAGCGQPAEDPPPPPEPAPTAEEAAKIEIKNVKTPLPGVLTGGQPTEEEFAAAVEAGYTTIVNLRPDAEEGTWDEASMAEELGVAYVHIPVASAADLTEENVAKLGAVLDDPANYPVMVHCASGNRVGAMLALRAHQLEGADAEVALEFGREGGLTKLEGSVREKLGLAADDGGS